MMDLDFLKPCSHKECSTHCVLHVAQCSQKGTDIIVLAVAHFHSLNIEELWIHFGVGKQYYGIYENGKNPALSTWIAYPTVTN